MLTELAYKLRKQKLILQNKDPSSYKPTTKALRIGVKLIASLIMLTQVRRQTSLSLLKHVHATPTYRRGVCSGQEP